MPTARFLASLRRPAKRRRRPRSLSSLQQNLLTALRPIAGHAAWRQEVHTAVLALQATGVATLAEASV